MTTCATPTDAAAAEQGRWMSLAEAAAYLRVGLSTVRDWLRDGRLTRYKAGARTLLDRRELDALVLASAG
jgi:excisionase family DNA binding protein